MKNHEERILAKLDEIGKQVGEIKLQLALNEHSHAVHIKRIDMLEERMAPVEQHVETMNAWGRFSKIVGGVVLGIATAVAAISRIFHTT